MTATARSQVEPSVLGQTGGMGFDATRQQHRRRSDPWIVAAAVAICLLLVLWALFG